MFGIALIDNMPFRIQCDVTLRPGDGDIILFGPVEESIEETINHGIRFANEIASFEAIEFPNLGVQSLHIRIRLPKFHAPVLGPSYGLLLVLKLMGTLLRRSPVGNFAVTGEVDGNGSVYSVGAISQKRVAAAEFGADAIILPAGQLDFFSTVISQIPVHNIYEAYTAVFYGKA